MHRWPKYWSFSFSFIISPSNEYSGLISLGLIGFISLQSRGLSRVYHSSKASILQLSAAFAFSLYIFCTTLQFSSVTQSCPTLCDPMDCSIPGLPVHHQLLELVQTHVHQVGDAIQLSHPLSSPSPPPFNLSQHQGLFQGVRSSH